MPHGRVESGTEADGDQDPPATAVWISSTIAWIAVTSSGSIAFMTFTGGEFGSVEALAERLNGLFWKERKLGGTTII